MAIPQPAEAFPTFVVYRDIKPGEPFDPTSPLLFFPEKGSDELFDALRLAFPHIKSHSERMREAVIRYLLEERQEERSLQTSPAMTMDTTWPSTGSAHSVLSTPETMNFSTPASFAPSPQPQATQMTRQTSTATSSQPSPPAIDQMTSVFSLSSSSQPKQRVRRKMTEAEKIEYRKRRIVKACDKCSKRKRKCPHNQSEMETLTSKTSNTSSRVSKSASPKLAKSVPEQQVVLDPSLFSMEDVNFADSFEFNAFAPIEDFDLFQDPFTDLDMNDMLPYDHFKPTNQFQPGNLFTPDVSPTQQDWQYNGSEDFNLLDSMHSDLFGDDDMNWLSQSSTSDGLYSSSGDLGRQVSLQSDDANHTNQHSAGMVSSSDSLSSSRGHLRQYGRLEDLQEVGRGHGGASGGNGRIWQQSRTELGSGTNGGSGNGMLWEHLRTGQSEKPVPTHTAHIHNAGCGGSGGLTTLPQTVLRLAGTRRAIQTFAGTLSQRTESASPVSMEQAAGLIRSALIHSHLSQHADGIQRSPSKAERSTPANRSLKKSSPGQSGSRTEQALSSTSVSVSRGSKSAALPQGRPVSSMDERFAARLPAATKSQQQGEPSLGGGLLDSADASMQLYMARKRVSSSLQKKAPATSANGGAYPRLETGATTSTSLAFKPAHTRARNPTASGFSGDTDQYHGAARTGLAVRTDIVTATTNALHVQPVQEDRLRDTKRFRDHHGRNGSQLSSYLLAMFGCMLLMQVASTFSLSTSALLLAFIMPAGAVENIMHCTIKNSRWLSAFASLSEAKYGWSAPSKEEKGSFVSCKDAPGGRVVRRVFFGAAV